MTDYSMDKDLVNVHARGNICNVYYLWRSNEEHTRFVIEFEINGSVELCAHGNIRVEESDWDRARDKFEQLHDLFCNWCGCSEKRLGRKEN